MPQLTDDMIRNYEIRQSLRLLNSNVAGKTADYNDIGFDLILAWGASNTVGYGAPIDPIENVAHPRVFQYASSGTRANTIYTAVDPLAHREIRANNHGNVFQFAKRVAAVLPGNRTVLILPCALGGTGFSENRWNPGNDLFNDSVARANTIIAQSPNNRLLCILNSGHGADAIALTDAAWIAAYQATIGGFRSQITRAANTVAMSVGATDAALPLDGGARQAKELLFANTLPNVISNYLYVSGSGLAAEGDNTHYNGASQIALGNRLFDRYVRWLQAQENARVN